MNRHQATTTKHFNNYEEDVVKDEEFEEKLASTNNFGTMFVLEVIVDGSPVVPAGGPQAPMVVVMIHHFCRLGAAHYSSQSGQ